MISVSVKDVRVPGHADKVTVDFSGEIVDGGIGAFECHGFRGVNVSLEGQVESATLPDGKAIDLDDLEETDVARAEDAILHEYLASRE